MLDPRSVLLCIIVALGAWSPPAPAAELRLVASVAMKSALDQIIPRFEAASGDHVSVQFGSAGEINRVLGSGQAFDVAIVVRPSLDALVKTGVVLADPVPVVGVAAVALAYRTGAPVPDISTVAAFKALVLGAPGLSLSDPVHGGYSSTYFMATLKRLGVEAEVAGKLVKTRVGEGASPVGAGVVPYGAAMTSEIAGVPGASAVPMFPDDPATMLTLSAAISGRAAEPKAARAFIDFLQSPESASVRKANGLMAG